MRLFGGVEKRLDPAGGDGDVPVAALRKARRQEQLVSKRLLQEDTAAEDGQDGVETVPDPLSEDEVKSIDVLCGEGGAWGAPRRAEEPEWGWAF